VDSIPPATSSSLVRLGRFEEQVQQIVTSRHLSERMHLNNFIGHSCLRTGASYSYGASQHQLSDKIRMTIESYEWSNYAAETEPQNVNSLILRRSRNSVI
jgi:hypothetical protein